jgi:hypothetical protein
MISDKVCKGIREVSAWVVDILSYGVTKNLLLVTRTDP